MLISTKSLFRRTALSPRALTHQYSDDTLRAPRHVAPLMPGPSVRSHEGDIFVITGIPASGKSTVAETLARQVLANTAAARVGTDRLDSQVSALLAQRCGSGDRTYAWPSADPGVVRLTAGEAEASLGGGCGLCRQDDARAAGRGAMGAAVCGARRSLPRSPVATKTDVSRRCRRARC